MQAPPDGNFVDFSDVWLAYNEDLLAQNHFAVEAIDLKVREGEFIAIVGPSGCGKSTFMKLATGLRMPSRGRILIDGQPVTGWLSMQILPIDGIFRPVASFMKVDLPQPDGPTMAMNSPRLTFRSMASTAKWFCARSSSL